MVTKNAKGVFGRRPRSANGMEASRISAAATLGLVPSSGAHALGRLVMEFRGCDPVRLFDHQPAVGRCRKAHAAGKALRQPLCRRAAEVEPEIQVLRGRTRTAGSAVPGPDVPRRSWCRPVHRSRRCPPAAIRNSWWPARRESGSGVRLGAKPTPARRWC